jgi:uncharacterized protein (DUF305 family)
MRALSVGLALAWIGAAPGMAQGDPHQHHHAPHHQHEQEHDSHRHAIGPAGSTYDLRWIDAMVQHHIGALRMSKFVFHISSPGVGALAHGIWDEQAREIKAMEQWRQAWYPEAPIYPVTLKPGGDPNSMADLERMGAAQIQAMQMIDSTPTRDNRVVWFLEAMIAHHNGALEMAQDALQKSRNSTVRLLAWEIIVAQQAEILELRRMLRRETPRSELRTSVEAP